MKVTVLASTEVQPERTHLVAFIDDEDLGQEVPSLSLFSAELRTALLDRLKSVEFKPGKQGVYRIDPLRNDAPTSILFAGWKDEKDRYFKIAAFRKVGSKVATFAAQTKAKQVVIVTGRADLSVPEHLEAFLEGIYLTAYRFDQFKSSNDNTTLPIEELVLVGPESVPDVRPIEALAQATSSARNLVNLPPNLCSPAHVVERCRSVAERGKLESAVFDRERLTEMEAELLLAVAKGSEQEPYLVKLVKKSREAKLKVALVGKGVTFDSGGLSIKTAQGMEEMKSDMAGAAAVLSVFEALEERELPIEVRGYLPLTENMISGKATRPGDIIKAMNGKTVEILNTDAEGRLILADALHLAVKEGADLIVDIATLTGAVVVALGGQYAAVYSDHDEYVQKLVEAGVRSGERLWRMPLAREYKDLLKSKTADLKNVGGRHGGSITAALFLQEFVGDVPWLHLDIAGTAFESADREHLRHGGTGFGVRTLVRFLEMLS